MPMTMSEKILSRKAGRRVYPGEHIVASVDLVYAHDGTAPLTIRDHRGAWVEGTEEQGYIHDGSCITSP